MAPVVKEHYLGFVGATFPDLLPRYERAYTGAYAPRAYRAALDARVDRIRAGYGFDEDSMRARRLVPTTAPARAAHGQLALPL